MLRAVEAVEGRSPGAAAHGHALETALSPRKGSACCPAVPAELREVRRSPKPPCQRHCHGFFWAAPFKTIAEAPHTSPGSAAASCAGEVGTVPRRRSPLCGLAPAPLSALPGPGAAWEALAGPASGCRAHLLVFPVVSALP